MNQTSLLSFIILFSCLLISTTLCSVNPKFLACEPQACGNGPNISYPFYIDGRQEPYCGFPRFDLLCNPDGFPSLNLSNTPYTVREISYLNHSLRVSNSAFSNECFSSRSKNLTLHGDRFNFPRNQKEVLLFFNCDMPEELRNDRVGCWAGNTTRSVVGLAMDDEKKLSYAASSCTGGPITTMVVEEEYRRKGIGEAVRRGFELNWKATECEACARSGGRCGFNLVSYSFTCYCRDDGDQLLKCPDKSRVLKLGLGLGLGIGVPGLLAIGVILWCHKRKYGNSEIQLGSRNGDIEDSGGSTSNVYFEVPVYSYEELEAATNNFHHSRELGDGGFGTVYYGRLQDGREVAVKRLYEQNYRRVQQFMNELRIITRLRHKNLVSLYGCTSRRSRELILVYEYVPNGTVAYHLDLHRDPKKPTILPWSTRMKIAIETASALAYLHASDTIHRDVKTNNILLDDGFNVKVADFGLSRLFPNDVTHVSTAPQGTPGYVDPEYHQSYQLTSKSDVYSFGVVLMELMSSMAAVDMSRDREEINLSSLAMRKILRSELSELVDPSLGFESDAEVKRMVVSVAQLAFQCLQRDRELRPSMEEVLEVLRRIRSGSGSGSDQVHQRPPLPPGSPNWDEVGLLSSTKLPPTSPNTVADKWESKSTTPNVSG